MNDLKGAIYNTPPEGRALPVVETRRLKQNAEDVSEQPHGIRLNSPRPYFSDGGVDPFLKGIFRQISA